MKALKEGPNKDVTMGDLRLLTDENLELTESEQLNKDLTALEEILDYCIHLNCKRPYKDKKRGYC